MRETKVFLKNEAIIGILLLSLIVSFFFMAKTTQANLTASSWSQIVGDEVDVDGLGTNENGFGDSNNRSVDAMAVFDNKLYAGVRNSNGTRIFSSSDGTTWTAVANAHNGFGDANNTLIRSMTVFNDRLYVGTSNSTDGTEVWRTSDGISWSPVVADQVDVDGTGTNENGFGDSNNSVASSITIFDNKLYIGTSNSTTGGEVFSTSNGTTWTRVNNDGFDGLNNNQLIDTMNVFQDEIYAAVGNAGGLQIWKSANGTSWSLARTLSPVQLLSYASSEFNDRLYFGMTTMTGGEVHSTADGTSWSELEIEESNNTEIIPMLEYGKKLYTGASDAINGGKLLETANGTSWTQVNTNGFGDSNNGYIVGASVFNYGLYVGINNSTDGTEIWSAQVSDSTGPSFSSQSPSNGTVDVSRDTNISFNVNDSIWEIDQSSIGVTIEGEAAISAGSCQTGYSCTIEDDGSDGYDVTINPGSDFGYSQAVNMIASASDGPGNSASTSWSFTTEAEPDDNSPSDGDSSPTGGVYRDRNGVMVDLSPKILTTSGPGEVTRLWAYDRRGNATDVKIEEDLFPSSYTGGAGIVAIDENNNYVRDQYLFFATSNGGPQARVMGLRSDGSTVLKGQQFVFQAPGDAAGTSSIRDGLSATVGDFDNDGWQDDAAFCLTGDYTPHVKVYTDVTGIDNWNLLNQFSVPIGPTGCNLGTFQYDTDASELLITPHHGPTTPDVYIYTVGGTLKKQFPAYDDPIDQGLTATSVNDRIYTTPNNGSSHVRAFDRDGNPKNFWWVYQQHVRGDFTIRAGDVDLDNKDELITSPIGANGPHVLAFEPTNKWRTWPNFFAFGDEALRNGVGIAVIENWHGVN